MSDVHALPFNLRQQGKPAVPTVGAAITFEVSNDSIVYLDVKYHSVQTEFQTSYLPISVGYRW
jgi:hypothetical protein